MKKALILLFLTLFIVCPAHATTDQKTIDFLENLNSYYYCLSREGLKNYSCDVSLTMTPEFEERAANSSHGKKFATFMDGLRYSVKGTPLTVPAVTQTAFPTTGNPKDDQSLNQISKSFLQLVDSMFITWTNMMVCPMHSQINYQGDCKVQNTSDGFTVTEILKQVSAVEYFDHQAKLLRVTTPAAAMYCDYSKTAQGYLLKTTGMNSDNQKQSIHYEFEPVGRFLMPKRMILNHIEPGLPQNSFSFILTFSNYSLNQ